MKRWQRWFVFNTGAAVHGYLRTGTCVGAGIAMAKGREGRAQPRAHVGALLTFVLSIAVVGGGCTGRGVTTQSQGSAQVPPVAFLSENVRFTNAIAQIELAGTLTLPVSKGPHPAVALITGSGPQDRDETIAGHKPFLVLAEYLASRGIAVLRYDDRGVGESTGNFAAATVHDFASDAGAAVEFLRKRGEIDRRRIGLAGHSEGGIVAPMASLALPGQVSFLVLLASPGVNGEQIFYLQDAAEQRARGVDAATIERNRGRKEQMFTVLKEEPDLAQAASRIRKAMESVELTSQEKADLERSGRSVDRMVNQQIRFLNTQPMRVFLTNDPLAALNRVTVPVLALIGEKDLQVPPKENLPLIEGALAKGRCPRYSVRELPGLNHLFQTSETGLPRDYAKIKETMSPVALTAIGDWIHREVIAAKR